MTMADSTTYRNKQFTLLRYAHAAAAVLHISSSVVLLALTWNKTTWTPSLELARDQWIELLGECNDTYTGRCFRQERIRDTYGIDLAALCVVFALWSGFLHFLIAFFDAPYQNYRKYLEQHYGRWRWADYIVSASIMIVVIAIYCGVVDTFLLAALGLLEAIVVVFGAASEKALAQFMLEKAEIEDGDEKSILSKDGYLTSLFKRFQTALWGTEQERSNANFLMARAMLGWGFVVFILLWVPIVMTFFLSVSCPAGTDCPTIPPIVYVIIFAYPFSFLSFGIVSLLNFGTRGRSYNWYEFNYILLSLITKVLLHWSIFFGLLVRGEQLENDQFERNAPGDVDEDALITVIVSVVSGGILLGLAFSYFWVSETGELSSLRRKFSSKDAKANTLLRAGSRTRERVDVRALLLW